MAKQKFPATPIRKGLYAKINIGRNELRWDDDDYRQVIADRFDGATSLTQLNVSELENLLEHMKGCGFKVKRKQGPRRGPPAAGTRPLASEPDAKKIRALWLSLYHLGVVNNPSEKALAGYVKRMSGSEALQFMDGPGAIKVIEGLKSWATRAGGVCWDVYPTTTKATLNRPRCRVLEAQWRRLVGLKAVYNGDHGLDGWAAKCVGRTAHISILSLSDIEADQVISALGEWIRREQFQQKQKAVAK